jgi:K+-transporting ATPase ATPase A chain
MDGKYRPLPVFRWFERCLDSGPMNWKQNKDALLIFNTILFFWGFIILSLQRVMPLNELSRGCYVRIQFFHDQYQLATLCRRSAFF